MGLENLKSAFSNITVPDRATYNKSKFRDTPQVNRPTVPVDFISSPILGFTLKMNNSEDSQLALKAGDNYTAVPPTNMIDRLGDIPTKPTNSIRTQLLTLKTGLGYGDLTISSTPQQGEFKNGFLEKLQTLTSVFRSPITENVLDYGLNKFGLDGFGNFKNISGLAAKVETPNVTQASYRFYSALKEENFAVDNANDLFGVLDKAQGLGNIIFNTAGKYRYEDTLFETQFQPTPTAADAKKVDRTGTFYGRPIFENEYRGIAFQAITPNALPTGGIVSPGGELPNLAVLQAVKTDMSYQDSVLDTYHENITLNLPGGFNFRVPTAGSLKRKKGSFVPGDISISGGGAGGPSTLNIDLNNPFSVGPGSYDFSNTRSFLAPYTGVLGTQIKNIQTKLSRIEFRDSVNFLDGSLDGLGPVFTSIGDRFRSAGQTGAAIGGSIFNTSGDVLSAISSGAVDIGTRSFRATSAGLAFTRDKSRSFGIGAGDKVGDVLSYLSQTWQSRPVVDWRLDPSNRNFLSGIGSAGRSTAAFIGSAGITAGRGAIKIGSAFLNPLAQGLRSSFQGTGGSAIFQGSVMDDLKSVGDFVAKGWNRLGQIDLPDLPGFGGIQRSEPIDLTALKNSLKAIAMKSGQILSSVGGAVGGALGPVGAGLGSIGSGVSRGLGALGRGAAGLTSSAGRFASPLASGAFNTAKAGFDIGKDVVGFTGKLGKAIYLDAKALPDLNLGSPITVNGNLGGLPFLPRIGALLPSVGIPSYPYAAARPKTLTELLRDKAGIPSPLGPPLRPGQEVEDRLVGMLGVRNISNSEGFLVYAENNTFQQNYGRLEAGTVYSQLAKMPVSGLNQLGQPEYGYGPARLKYGRPPYDIDPEDGRNGMQFVRYGGNGSNIVDQASLSQMRASGVISYVDQTAQNVAQLDQLHIENAASPGSTDIQSKTLSYIYFDALSNGAISQPVLMSSTFSQASRFQLAYDARSILLKGDTALGKPTLADLPSRPGDEMYASRFRTATDDDSQIGQWVTNTYYPGNIQPGVDQHTLEPITENKNSLVESPQHGMPFYFKDLRDNKFVVLRAYLVGGITDDYSPNWNTEEYLGRSEPVYIYQNTVRNLNFTLRCFALSAGELDRMYGKLEKLSGMAYPEYREDGDLFGKVRMRPPLVRMRLGELYGTSKTVGTLGFFNSLNVSFPENTVWEHREGARVPKYFDISMNYTVISEGVPEMDSKRYGISTGTDLSYKQEKYGQLSKALEQIPNIDLDTINTVAGNIGNLV